MLQVDAEIRKLIQFVQFEEPDSALDIWDQIVRLDGGSAVSLFGRGQANLLLFNWQSAIDDLSTAIPLMTVSRGSAQVTLPTGKVSKVDAHRQHSVKSIGI